jgi:pimeloyl-ACP methyl ester carboxylesterase
MPGFDENETRGREENMEISSKRALRAAAVAMSLFLGIVLQKPAPVVAAASCGDLAEGKCKIQLSTGITMAYVETGPASGKPVILIHGYTDTMRSWSFAMRALHKTDPSLRLIAIDLRGHGDSSMPSASDCASAPEKCFHPDILATDVVAFMKAKNISQASLAGHSLGSFVSQDVALSHPEMVDHLVLVATSMKVVDNPVIRDFVLRDTIEGSWKGALEAKGKKYPVDFYELTPLDADPEAKKWVATTWDADVAADPATLVPLIPETSHVRLGTWIGVAKAVLATDNTEQLKKLKVPTLVLWGTQDTIFSDDDQKNLRQILQDAAKANGIVVYWKQYGVIPLPASGEQDSDIGHSLQWEAPDAVAADLDSFIKTGAPTKDLAHSDKAPNVSHILVEPGTATVMRLE